MEHVGLSFPEAVNKLAQSVGLTVPNESMMVRNTSATAHDRYKHVPIVSKVAAIELLEVMRTACSFYCKQLRGAKNAIQYLKKRGLIGEIAARFSLGYAPAGWKNLEIVFPDYRNDSLLKAGLVIMSEKKDKQAQAQRYDRFRERIIFPIRNIQGRVIGFGGRVLNRSEEPKYLNSPETLLFNKSNELYGLFEARLAIRERHYVLVVEGYMDVVTLAQCGFENVVATLGTACTSTHVQKLLRRTDTIIFSFDGDTAGRQAARRALNVCLPYAADNRITRFLFLPPEHDPDSYVRKFGTDAFASEIERAIPLSKFLLSEVLENKDLDQPEGRARVLFDAKPLLQALPANALRSQIMHTLAKQLNLSFEEIVSFCIIDKQIAVVTRSRLPHKDQRTVVTGIERRMLRNLVMHPRIALELDDEAKQTLLTLTHHRELFKEVAIHTRALGQAAAFQLLSDLLCNGEHAATFEKIFREILNCDENVRDLLLKNPKDATVIEECRIQEKLAAKELQAAIFKIRYDTCCERLDVLSQQSQHTPKELTELIDLNQKRTKMKRQLGL